MAQIDPKWIQYDDTKLTIIDNGGVNELSIRDDILIDGLNAELINNSKIQVRFLASGDPAEEAGRNMTQDIWIQVPDQV